MRASSGDRADADRPQPITAQDRAPPHDQRPPRSRHPPRPDDPRSAPSRRGDRDRQADHAATAPDATRWRIRAHALVGECAPSAYARVMQTEPSHAIVPDTEHRGLGRPPAADAARPRAARAVRPADRLVAAVLARRLGRGAGGRRGRALGPDPVARCSARSRCAARAASTTTSSIAISTRRSRARAAGRSRAARCRCKARLGLAGRAVPDRAGRAAAAARCCAQIVALASLAPVAAYPFMKRITWWPQAWLGLVFSWARAGRLERRSPARSMRRCWLLYAGSIAWVIGYDTIYALQDRRGRCAGRRPLVGARAGRARAGRASAIFYALALALWARGVLAGAARPARARSRCCRSRCISRWQVATLDPADGADALARFRSNRFAGLLMFLACVVVGTS